MCLYMLEMFAVCFQECLNAVIRAYLADPPPKLLFLRLGGFFLLEVLLDSYFSVCGIIQLHMLLKIVYFHAEAEVITV